MYINEAYKYPEQLLENRMSIEGKVIGCFWKSPELFQDYKEININSFVSEDGRFYYSLGNLLSNKKYEIFDETTVYAFLNENKQLLESFVNKGGYDNIKEVMSVINLNNTSSYIDELFKANIILNLYDEGFNVLSEITIIEEGKEKCIIPIELFKKMTSQQVSEFYEWRLASITLDKQLSDVEIEDFDLDDKFFDDCNAGASMGIPYSTLGLDIDGNKIHGFPRLNDATLGTHKGSVEIISAHSGKGKSNFVMLGRVLPVLESGENVVIMANEMRSDAYKKIFVPMILVYKFKYYGITKRTLTKGNFTEEQWMWIKKAQDYYKKHYKGRVKFIKLDNYGINSVQKIVKKYARQGFGYFLYDVLKGENMASTNIRGEIIETSKQMFRLADKYNVAITCVQQLAIHTENIRYLTAGALSEAKGVKEVVSELILFRWLWDDEYDGEKYDIKPYNYIRDDLTGKYTKTKEYITLDKDKKYAVIFLDKTRNGDSDVQLVYEINLAYNTWKEIGFCKVQNTDRR